MRPAQTIWRDIFLQQNVLGENLTEEDTEQLQLENFSSFCNEQTDYCHSNRNIQGINFLETFFLHSYFTFISTIHTSARAAPGIECSFVLPGLFDDNSKSIRLQRLTSTLFSNHNDLRVVVICSLK